MILARKWGFTKAGGPRGYALVRAGEALPRFVAAEPQMPDPAAVPPAEPKATGNVIYIYDVIGYDFWSGGGCTSEQVMQDLAALGETADVDVRINSPGGEVFEGVAIFNALARHKGKVTVHIDALSASIATVVQLAGAPVLMAENALMMIHLPYTCMCGNADELRATAEILDKLWAAMVATYSRRTGMTAAALRKKISESPYGEWWLTAEEAVKVGFADEVEKPVQVKAMAEGSRFRGGPDVLRVAAEGGQGRAPASPSLEAPRTVCEAAERRRRLAEVAALES